MLRVTASADGTIGGRGVRTIDKRTVVRGARGLEGGIVVLLLWGRVEGGLEVVDVG